MKIAIAQLNPIVGDLVGNAAKIIAAYVEGANQGAELIIAPECVLTGYPLEDLVLRASFIEAVRDAVHEIYVQVSELGLGASLIVGAPFPSGDGVTNSAFIFDPKAGTTTQIDKYELPNYGVFDEKRVFLPSNEPTPIHWRGYVLGLMICEDCWFPRVSKKLMDDGATILISINGSPYEDGKNVVRRKVVAERIAETGLPFLYVNMVGGQDELVFDGGSFFYDNNGIQEAPHFKEGVFAFNVNMTKQSRYEENGRRIAFFNDYGEMLGWDEEPRPLATLTNYPSVDRSGIAEIYQACVLGLRDYMTKQGFKRALLGYSGGVDSGIVAAMACDAFGADKVHLVRLPSKFSSEGSLTDAKEGADRLGAHMRTIPIEPVVEALRAAYSSGSDGAILVGVADENIQARARGNILMAISNQEGHLLLTTGNKSEISTGYTSLYGDMSGGFNPIKDCYKTTVWALCRWRNSLTKDQLEEYDFLGREAEVVPEAIIVKPPSAELRPDQKDEDSLPAYPVLDAILKAMIENELSVSEVVNQLSLDISVVQRIRQLVDNAEYKRRQAAPGVKISSKIFGRDRRYPIINRWRG